MTLILSGTNGLSDVDGDASTPAVRGTDANSGIFFGADTVGVSTGGSEKVSVGASAVVVNDGGANVDFRVEGDTEANLLFVDASAEAVGIGVAPSPYGSGSYKALQIGGSTNIMGRAAGSDAYFMSNTYFDQTNYKYVASLAAARYTQSSGEHQWFTAPSGTAGNTISFTQAMTLDASGNLLVGTTSKLSGGVDGLDINTANETGITFGKSGTVKAYFYLLTDESAFQWQTVSGVAINVVSSTNGVTLANGGTSWGALSDERKKDIIEPIANAAEKVSSLRAVIGKYKTDDEGTRRSLLIAQDVQAVLPEAVVENHDGDLILQYTDTIPLLVAAIKELKAELDTVKAELATLKG